MMSRRFEQIEVERRGPVQWISLSRPDQMNAMTTTMIEELTAALGAAASDPSMGAVVFSGKGRAFCAGADLKETPSQADVRAGRRTFFDVSDELASLLSDYPRPLVSALNGVTCAGGLEIALFADVILAARDARIGDVHSNFGLLPGLGGSVRLARAVGTQRARYLMMSGDLLSAEEAAAWGLVAKVVDAAVLHDEAQALAERLASKSLAGLMRMRRLVEGAAGQPMEPALRLERLVFREYYQSPEVAEGQAAFREKRKPEFGKLRVKPEGGASA